MRKKKFTFTLLEIVICLSLLTSIGSFALINGYKLLQSMRRTQSCKQLKKEILLTRVLSITHNIDIEVLLIPEKTKTILIRKTDLPHPKIASLFNKKIILQNLIIKEKETLYFYPANATDTMTEKISSIIIK